MKVIHIADLHLGAMPQLGGIAGIDRGRELWETFARLIDFVREKRADLLLVAGDMFHRQPLLRELKEVNYYFESLKDTSVVIIAGNHDYIKPDSYYNTFKWADNVCFIRESECTVVSIPNLNVDIYGLSYNNYEIREPLYDNIAVKDRGKINILLAHGGDEKHISFSKGKLLEKGFNYIALGHIHKPQVLADNLMAYSGALEPVDINDEGIHGFIAADIKKNETKLSFIKFAKREYITLNIDTDPSYTSAGLKALIKEKLAAKNKNNIYRINIKGIRDADITYEFNDFMQLGNIAEVRDFSEPDYDFEVLKKANQRNIIGCYIDSFDMDSMNETDKLALYYGVRAMLDEMR